MKLALTLAPAPSLLIDGASCVGILGRIQVEPATVDDTLPPSEPPSKFASIRSSFQVIPPSLVSNSTAADFAGSAPE